MSHDRYVIEVADQIVILIDTATGNRDGFLGPERLEHAVLEMNRRDTSGSTLDARRFNTPRG